MAVHMTAKEHSTPRGCENITAVFQGSFDPVTYGHLDVIRRAARLFNKLVVGIGQNPDKEQLLTPEERLKLLLPHIAVRIAVSPISTFITKNGNTGIRRSVKR